MFHTTPYKDEDVVDVTAIQPVLNVSKIVDPYLHFHGILRQSICSRSSCPQQRKFGSMHNVVYS